MGDARGESLPMRGRRGPLWGPLRRLDELPERLRGFFLVNFLALTSSLVTLAILTPIVGSRRMLANLILLAVAEVVLLAGFFAARRFGPRAIVYGVLASVVVFVSGAVLVTPFLSPLFVLLLIAPVLLGVPYLPRREIAGMVVIVLLTSSAVAAFATHRLDLVRTLPPTARVISLAVAVPVVVSVLAYEVVHLYRELTDQASELRESRNQVVEVANAARRSLERDLHDGAQQQLVGMSVQISRIRDLLGGDADPEVAAALRELNRQAMASIRELRELAQGIYPPLLAERGLNAALHAAARRSTLPCTLLDEPIPRLAAQVEAAVYFCILEALQNAAKHSGAGEVTVQIRAVPQLEFAVIDDGAGFDPAAASSRGGLLGMEARVAAVGGILSVDSAPGAGTTIRAAFPADPAELGG